MSSHPSSGAPAPQPSPSYVPAPAPYPGAPSGYAPQQPAGAPMTGGQPGAPYPPAGYPAQPGSPYAPQPPTPRRGFLRRHKVLTTFGVLVVLGIVIGIANAGGSSDAPAGASAAQDKTGASGTHAKAADEPAAKPAAKPKPKPKTAGLGDPVRDGKFEFTVTKVDAPVATIGDEFLSTKAQGGFVKVHVTVKNIGDEPRTFDDSSQVLRDAQGRQFDADSEAGIYLDDSNSFLEDVNPGNSIKGILVFDLPKGTDPASLELHDSVFSGGVTVALR